MQRFAQLLDRLYYTHGNRAKAALLVQYFSEVSDPDRGWALAALSGELRFDLFKRHTVRELIQQRVDPYLFNLSRDYVGETSETVAHLWPENPQAPRLNRLPSLSEVVERFSTSDRQGVRDYLTDLLDAMTPEQRWALLKLGTRGLRVGVSARFAKNVLAAFGGIDVGEVEAVWHGLQPPYEPLFSWLEGRGPRPDVRDAVTFHPVMLAHPIEERELPGINPTEFVAEWKYDGIRVQLVTNPNGKAIFSRTGDDISAAFPDLLAGLQMHAVLDGELVVRHSGALAPFNAVQQRLNKKKPSGKLMEAYPAHVILYDALELDGVDLRPLPLQQRQNVLAEWVARTDPARMSLSPPLIFCDLTQLEALRASAEKSEGKVIEGLMLKRKDSPYIPGRPKGYWYKWKRDPLLLDAVLMYAQRGSGKRSSFYSDYTFGLWKEGELLPIGKAYSGFTDAELKRLDAWIRNHTTNSFGPVREVEKTLVLEVAFDSAHESPRHKSGYALRFPRIHRIRWDKPATEADVMATLAALVSHSMLS